MYIYLIKETLSEKEHRPWTMRHNGILGTKQNELFKVAGNRICTVSMHLCKEYARSATTHIDNTRYIYEKVL